MLIAQTILLLLFSYAGLGLAFALLFVARGIERLDHAARGSAWGFRILMIPGCALLWPLMLKRWRNAGADS